MDQRADAAHILMGSYPQRIAVQTARGQRLQRRREAISQPQVADLARLTGDLASRAQVRG